MNIVFDYDFYKIDSKGYHWYFVYILVIERKKLYIKHSDICRLTGMDPKLYNKLLIEYDINQYKHFKGLDCENFIKDILEPNRDVIESNIIAEFIINGG